MEFYLYSGSTGGFYSREWHGDSIPLDAVEITPEYHAALMAGRSAMVAIMPDESGYPVLVSAQERPRQAPSRVSMRQARLALHDAGLLVLVEIAIDALEDPQKTKASIEWNYASEVLRDSEFVAMIGMALELSDVELDSLFLAASLL